MQLPEDQFVVALSSSALFDTREGDRLYREQGEEAFIAHQIANEDSLFAAGPAMPIAKALLAASKAIQGESMIKLIVLSHNNPAASVRAMKSAAAHGLPVERASFVGGAPLERYLEADNVALLLSRNGDDVRTALGMGIAAAMVQDCIEPPKLEENQLRVAFDFDAVIASDESERVFKAVGRDRYFANEAELEKVPLQPGPFAPVLRWVAKLQKELASAGAPFMARTAIVTARNQAAMNRVILTMRNWNVRVDETHFLGTTPKDRVLQAFRPHIFFDDQLKNVASGVVPSGHVPYGIANEKVVPTEPADRVAPSSPTIDVVTTAAAEMEAVTSITKGDFQTRCRAILRSYVPLGRQGKALDERYRVFIAENANRSGVERAKILNGLKRYDLSEFLNHDPILNRELGNMAQRKLDKIVAEAVAPVQQSLGL